jgi:organic hydroperoxide reductase OsmC/OhrA
VTVPSWLLNSEPVEVETTITVNFDFPISDRQINLKCEVGEMTATVAEVHRFQIVAWWASGRTGFAKSNSAPHAIHFSAPPAFGGMDGRWTPEDLLLCALAGCYTTTFRTVAESSKIAYADLQVEVEGYVKRAEVGYRFSEIAIRANLTIAHQGERDRALKLLHKAHELCLVARALSVEQKFEPAVQCSETGTETPHSLPVCEQ